MNNKINFLPIGSVVLLKEATKAVMIVGYCVVVKEQKKVYDYSAVLYPEGFIGSDKSLVFDHKDIAKVLANGYSNEEEKEFRRKLSTEIERIVKETIEELK